MTIDRFVEERSQDWKELEKILGHTRSRSKALSREELDELGRLYMRSISDLAYARENFAGHEITDYLNQMVARAYSQIYIRESFKLSDMITFYTREFPCVFRHTISYTLVAFFIFALAACAGYLMMHFDRELATIFVPENVLETVEKVADSKAGNSPGHQAGSNPAITDELKPLFSSFIMTNNIQVAFIAFSTGIFLGLGTVWVLIRNGLMIGILACVFQEAGQALPFWALILPHGILELTAIFISGGAGLLLGYALINPGDLTRKDSLLLRGKEAIKLIFGLIPILIIAAIIEGFITPSEIPPVAKILFAMLTGIALFSYLLKPGGKMGK